jgi:alkylation response protein AidB-like acyl-CoA dehydrogenase
MDVEIPPIPASYDGFRAKVVRFIEEKRPRLDWKPRAGVRVPDSEANVAELRRWFRDLFDAGYVLHRASAPDADPFEQRILAEEITRAGLPPVLGNPLAATAIERFGTEAQKRAYLPAIPRGDHIWTQLFSEPNAGSDLASLETRARRDGDAYVVDGQKVWSTWAQFADYGYLLARTDPDAEKHRGITAFILDMRSPGVDVRPLREMTGTTDFNEVFLEGVRVPVENVIGEPGDGWRVATQSLVSERSAVGGGEGGLGATVRELVALAKTSRRNGRAASEDGHVRQELGRFLAAARVHKLLGYKSATRAARGESSVWEAPLSKIFFSELNLAMDELALALEGPSSILTEEDPLAVEGGRWQDRFLYARAWTIAGGSNEILRNLIAERGLGMPREAKKR